MILHPEEIHTPNFINFLYKFKCVAHDEVKKSLLLNQKYFVVFSVGSKFNYFLDSLN